MTNEQQKEQVADWYTIAKLIGQRWPQWEPNDIERADWRRAIGYREFDLIDEAMLQVKMKYSSAVPQLKWILGEFNKLKEAKYEHKKEQRYADSQAKNEIDLQEVKDARQSCIDYLHRQPAERLAEAACTVRSRYGGLLPMSDAVDPKSWGWAMRFAVMLALQDRPS